MVVVRWRDWEGHGLEHCVCHQDTNGIVLEGVVAGTRHGAYGGHYLVRTDADFRTREVHVQYISGPRLHLQADGVGNWSDMIENKSLPVLQGCIDVDIGITPATNTLPIKRLKLEAHESHKIKAAYVPLPDQIDGMFLPQLAEQRYTCLIPEQRYRYEGIFRDFTAELSVDTDGLVIDYPDTFRRVTSQENSIASSVFCS